MLVLHLALLVSFDMNEFQLTDLDIPVLPLRTMHRDPPVFEVVGLAEHQRSATVFMIWQWLYWVRDYCQLDFATSEIVHYSSIAD